MHMSPIYYILELMIYRNSEKVVQPTMVFGADTLDFLWSSGFAQGFWEGMPRAYVFYSSVLLWFLIC